MNIKITLYLLLITSTLFSVETQFDEMINTDLDAVWELENSKDNSVSAILDCQSFFHKLDFFHNASGEVLENFLTTQECQDLYYKVSDCIRVEGSVCIETDNILEKQCQCNSR